MKRKSEAWYGTEEVKKLKYEQTRKQYDTYVEQNT